MENVVVYGKLKDIDTLSNILGKNIINLVELTYLDSDAMKYINNNRTKLLYNIGLVLKFCCTEEDLEKLDNYYECPLKYHRAAIILRGETCWIYYKNLSKYDYVEGGTECI